MELHPWEYKEQFTVRLTSFAAQTILLPRQFTNVRAIYLVEDGYVGYNGAVSAGYYLNIQAQNVTTPAVNNDNVRGQLVFVDVLNPHTSYSEPRLIATGNNATLQSFTIEGRLSTGAAPAITEACLVFTVVMHLPVTVYEEVRRKLASWMANGPQIKGPDPRAEYRKQPF